MHTVTVAFSPCFSFVVVSCLIQDSRVQASLAYSFVLDHIGGLIK